MKFILFLIVLSIVIAAISPTDSTDRGHLKRSGLRLYIDATTGCHYIKGGMFGQMIPRLDKDGEHVCDGWGFEGKK